jgi:hypothetical protein
VNALETAKSYINRGWNPVPIPHKSKRPVGDGWQLRIIDGNNAHQFFNGAPQNVGVLMGPTSGGLSDVDLDCPEAIALAPFILPKSGAIFGRETSRASHWLYKTALAQKLEKATLAFKDPTPGAKKVTLVEIRVGGDSGAQTVFPGSTHETGEAIRWEEAGEPSLIDDDELLKKVQLLAVGCLFIRYWPGEGGRHDAALAVGGFLVRAGQDPSWIKYFVEFVSRSAGDPESADRKQAAFDAATGFHAGKKTYGLPGIKKLFGELVAKQVAEWLDYHSGSCDYETGSRTDDQSFVWSDPTELPSSLRPVAPFDFEYLPISVAPWVRDISDRMQCPPDFVAVSAIAALGSALGRKIGIRPQQQTNWLEVPNFWACIVGRPGAMKSPAMAEALKPLQRLEAEARKSNEDALRDFAADKEAFEIKKQHAQKKAKTALERGEEITKMLRIDQPEPPKSRRFIINDCTYEALGEILADNPTGILASRDELISLLKTLDREEYAAARGFFLTAWNGTSGYTFDRIMRGRTHIEAACVSLLGSTQPGKIAEYMRRAVHGGSGDDGLIQRFGLLVWPDQTTDWKDVDRYPDTGARQLAWDTFQRLADLTPAAVGAEMDQFEAIPFLRFDEPGQALFSDWRETLERRLRGGELHPSMESHLSKYRKLVPALALINHVADGGRGPVDELAALRAVHSLNTSRAMPAERMRPDQRRRLRRPGRSWLVSGLAI